MFCHFKKKLYNPNYNTICDQQCVLSHPVTILQRLQTVFKYSCKCMLLLTHFPTLNTNMWILKSMQFYIFYLSKLFSYILCINQIHSLWKRTLKTFKSSAHLNYTSSRGFFTPHFFISLPRLIIWESSHVV